MIILLGPSLSVAVLSNSRLQLCKPGVEAILHDQAQEAEVMADEQDMVTPAPPSKDTPENRAAVDSAAEDNTDPSKTHINIVEHARSAAHKERTMTLRQGIKLYPKAIFWSILISTCIVMEGYDISLVNNFCMCGPTSWPSACDCNQMPDVRCQH